MRHPLQFAILMKSDTCTANDRHSVDFRRKARAKEEREIERGGWKTTRSGGGQRLWTYLVTVDLPHWVFRWLRWEKKGFLSFKTQGQGSSHILKECRDDVYCRDGPNTWLPPPPPPPPGSTHTYTHPSSSWASPCTIKGSGQGEVAGARWGASVGLPERGVLRRPGEPNRTGSRLFTWEGQQTEEWRKERGEEVIKILSSITSTHSHKAATLYSLA